MNNFAVEINGLEKTYKTESESLTILKNLDLRIEEGSKVVIIGESGSGKSTFLRIPLNLSRFNFSVSLSFKRFYSSRKRVFAGLHGRNEKSCRCGKGKSPSF